MTKDNPTTSYPSDSEEVHGTPWHVLSVSEVVRKLGVNLQVGLPIPEVAQRITKYGPNEIPEPLSRRPWRMFLDQFTDFMILVLIAAAVVSGVIGESLDAVAIGVIVFLNGIVGFVQEYRAERAVSALKKLAAPSALVRRGGQQLRISATQLVPGDLVLLEAGNIIPSDLRFVETVRLKVDEAALTGESVPVDKHAAPLEDPDLAIGDRLNLGYKGTLITYGRGTGVVVSTGQKTELGKIASLLRDDEGGKTPLQKRLAVFGKRLALAVLAICLIVLVSGIFRGEPFILMFLTSISLAVAAIPEALPAVVTVSLAMGARKMVRKNALIRRLPAVETLGSVTYVCSDKTGTLTENKMQVDQILAGGRLVKNFKNEAQKGEPWSLLFRGLALSNDAERDHKGKTIGDPTEVALYEAAREAGYDKKML